MTKAPDQAAAASIIAYYPYELDEVSLVWKHTRQSPLTLEGSSSFLNFENPITNLVTLKRILFFGGRDDVDFQVNSRSSSFQEGVSDTDRFRAVLEIFRYFWKPRKGVRMKSKSWHQKRSNLATRSYKSRREKISDQSVYLINPEKIGMICLFKYFMSWW